MLLNTKRIHILRGIVYRKLKGYFFHNCSAQRTPVNARDVFMYRVHAVLLVNGNTENKQINYEYWCSYYILHWLCHAQVTTIMIEWLLNYYGNKNVVLGLLRVKNKAQKI